jgi:hypothetical protein
MVNLPQTGVMPQLVCHLDENQKLKAQSKAASACGMDGDTVERRDVSLRNRSKESQAEQENHGIEISLLERKRFVLPVCPLIK